MQTSEPTPVSITVGDQGWAATFPEGSCSLYVIAQTAFEARRAAERSTQ